jgi:HEAT repeat protein
MLLLLALFGLAGCGKKEAVRPPLGPENIQPAQDLYKVHAPDGPQPLTRATDDPAAGVYQGLTPKQWAEQLQTRDLKTQSEAIQALGALKEHGYPELKEGLQSESADVRVLTLQAIQLPVLMEHDKEVVPKLIDLLQTDRNPTVREQAAIRLAWFDNAAQRKQGHMIQQRFQALQRAAQADPNAAVRQAANNSMLCLQSALSGKIASD